MQTVQSVAGIFGLLALAFAISENRRAVSFRQAAIALGLTVVLAALPPDALSERSRLIMLYGLCGFANLGSLGIMIGGLATMAPERRDDVVALGFKSIVSGTLSTCVIGAVASALT